MHLHRTQLLSPTEDRVQHTTLRYAQIWCYNTLARRAIWTGLLDSFPLSVEWRHAHKQCSWHIQDLTNIQYPSVCADLLFWPCPQRCFLHMGLEGSLVSSLLPDAVQAIGHQLSQKLSNCMSAEMFERVLRSNSSSIYVSGDKDSSSEGGMLRDVLFNVIGTTLAPSTVFWEPYVVPLLCLVLLASWERYGTWAFYNTGAD